MLEDVANGERSIQTTVRTADGDEGSSLTSGSITLTLTHHTSAAAQGLPRLAFARRAAQL